ncbi:MAG: hypothetical protein ABJK59_05450 [Erythrobacter sp.]|uniref:hypothetical protein n=1 Tax=Erythrobacter sp. TaxID=1042 RepID=UPI003296FFEB
MGQAKDDTSSDDLENHHDVSAAMSVQPRTTRPMQVRENLDVLMRQVEHARREADQMIEDMSALEVDAGQATALRRETESLRDKLEDASRETIAQVAKAKEASREVGRMKEEIGRIRTDYEKSQREANANALEAERIGDRLHTALESLNEAKRDIEALREAKDKAEVEASCLRTNLVERERAQAALMRQEQDLRMQVAQLKNQNEEITDALSRKERVVLEKSAEVDAAKDKIADLESNAESSREEIRVLGNKYSELKVSQESRIFALNDGLSQERESHRMTLRLLEEARTNNDTLNDDNAVLKDQNVISSRDAQKLKRDLTATRTQVHEYGDKLKEAHLRIDCAHGDIQRLETQLEDAKKDAVTLQRQANKFDQLLSENSELHEKLARMQQSLDRRRDPERTGDLPIMLTSANAMTMEGMHKDKVKATASASPNVARIRRR